ncbi:MAG: U32 family peptidase, partial [Elusimicrobia bacterium]|nr:U32 family peptidase [Elusimicrobiota bacterium]
ELDLPPVPLIASTQTHNTTPEKVLFLEKAGFKRVILARELSIEEIKKIRAKTSVELECFVHGALCASYSGQCYLSLALGGRSGNRGVCAQPCRKLYTLKDAADNVLVQDKHLLSLKDLNLSKRLGALLDAGVTSLKIEGRLKDRDYVRNVVSWYRKELDAGLRAKGLARSSAGRSFISFTPDLNKTFNRGYTEYFFNGRSPDVASPDTPKFLGERVGRAVKANNKSFVLAGNARLNNGDGIAFFDPRGALAGSLVTVSAEGRVLADSARGMAEGTVIYRNLDREFLRALERAAPERKLGVRFEFTETPEGFALKAASESGITAEASCRPGKTRAVKTEQALETIKKQLSKVGETGFYLLGLEVKLSAPYFIPVGALNELRRKVLDKLGSALAAGYKREEKTIEKNKVRCPEKELDFTANILNSKALEFYKRHGVVKTAPAAESGLKLTGRALMTLKFCIRHRLGMCPKTRAGEKPGPLYLEDEEGRLFRLEFDCAACRMTLRLGKQE